MAEMAWLSVCIEREWVHFEGSLNSEYSVQLSGLLSESSTRT